jgi:hypothetical protein
MRCWPDDWACEPADVPIGRRIVAQMEGFVYDLHASGLAPSTIRRHLDGLHLLGGKLICNRHFEDPPGKVPDLALVIDDEGGPLIDGGHSITDQKAFDATCRKLNKFLNRPDQENDKSQRSRKRKPMAIFRLAAMIAEATTDAYGPEEESGGLLVYLQEEVSLPFMTAVLGVDVQVIGFDSGPGIELVAVCKRGKARQRIPVQDLPLPRPPPSGHEWIAAYKRWLAREG